MNMRGNRADPFLRRHGDAYRFVAAVAVSPAGKTCRIAARNPALFTDLPTKVSRSILAGSGLPSK
ncbi:hypothetical protein PQR75_46250 [Paraburkholderia fungorum]|uniref:hypothetical protein n=1 Tax=Paraburkholderia fungorum TaxID=134537 RepID=UPI0038B8E37B